MRTLFAVMRGATRRFAAAACVLLLAGCAYALVNGASVDQGSLEKVEQGIQRIRQLNFLRPVPVAVKDRDEAEKLMEADLMRDYTDNQLRVDGTAGSMVGLYPPGMDLKAESLKLLRNQVAGFYDPRSKQMVLVKGGADLGFFGNTVELVARRDIAGEMVLSHELTHALQDQHFDLERKLDRVKNNDDRAIALKCLAEGDATIAGYAYVAGRMDDGVADALLSHLGDIAKTFASQAPETPEGISVPVIFQYSDGVRMVAEAYRRGGWSAVDAMYAKPPLSTHQVIHSADYFDHFTPPVNVEVRGYERVMGSWTKIDDDTYGELLLRTILERNLGRKAPEVAVAQRWAGDQMVILQSGREVSVIWLLVFSDETSAAGFAGAYAKVIERNPPTIGRSIENRGRAVLVMLGASAASKQIAESIWAESRIGDGAAISVPTERGSLSR